MHGARGGAEFKGPHAKLGGELDIEPAGVVARLGDGRAVELPLHLPWREERRDCGVHRGCGFSGAVGGGGDGHKQLQAWFSQAGRQACSGLDLVWEARGVAIDETVILLTLSLHH